MMLLGVINYLSWKYMSISKTTPNLNCTHQVFLDLSILDVIALQLHEPIVAAWSKCAAQARSLPASPGEVLQSLLAKIHALRN